MFMGKGEFVWFMGVVEDRVSDPLKLGRCKVRCLGFHTKDTTQLPTADLPWATMMQPITSSAMQGIGQTPLGPMEGTWVIGFFRDGVECQEPVVIGTVGGIPEETVTPNTGFADPYGINPTTKRANGHGINEADTNRLARNDSSQAHTVLTVRTDNVETTVPLANELGNWNEPVTDSDVVYPFNHVKESESGHIEEIDDTPGAERTLKWHRSGTFDEVHPDGSRVTKIVGDSYEIVLQDKHIYIKGHTGDDEMLGAQYQGNLYVTINGDVTEYIKGNVERQIDGSVREIIKGNYTQMVAGNRDITTGGHSLQKIGGDSTESVQGVLSHNIQGDVLFSCEAGEMNITALSHVTIGSSDSDVRISGSNNVKILAGRPAGKAGDVTIAGDNVNINGDIVVTVIAPRIDLNP